jgi:DNA-binding LacI/PurR family transcriptional regulator
VIHENKRITLSDIAEMVGVSKTIISKVANAHPNVQVSKAKRQKIEDIIRRYNYRPLSSAQSLATRRTRQIAFMLSSQTTLGLANPYFAKTLAGVYDGCAKHAYQCMVTVYDFSDISQFMMPENLCRLSIDGCILSGYFDINVLQKMDELRVPMVMGNGPPLKNIVSAIPHCNPSDLRVMFDYITGHGHRDIWFASDLTDDCRSLEHFLPGYSPPVRVRILPRRDAADEFAYGKLYAAEFLNLPPGERPTLVYGSDHFGAAFLSELRAGGVNCPRDISFLSGAETTLAQWHQPPLTTFDHDCYRIGLESVEVLVRLLDGAPADEETAEPPPFKQIHRAILERNSISTLNSL